MRLYAALIMSLALVAQPALAERLNFDHRLHPDLKAVLDSGRNEMVLYDSSNPGYLVDRIAVQGRSATDWTEALEIIARTARKGMKRPSDWMDQLGRHDGSTCRDSFTVLARDENSVTFETAPPLCPGAPARVGLYRIVAGKTSLFLLAAMARETMTDESRQKWLALLASARLD